MNLYRQLFLYGFALAGSAFAQPVVSSGGILNVASYALNPLPNSWIAQGSMFTVFGERLGPAPRLVSALPLTTMMDGVSVRVTSGGQTVDAFPVYVSPTQLIAVLPSRTPTSDQASLTVSFNGQTSTAVTFRIVRSSFGIFTSNEAGSGPAAAQNVAASGAVQVNTVANVARPGQTITLWGTGLGPVSGDEAASALPGDRPEYNVEVFIGGRPARVMYRGRSGCCVGIDQIVAEIPQGVEGCYVPVVVRVDGMVSNFATVSIGRTGERCVDRLGISEEDIQTAERNDGLRTGDINLTHATVQASVLGLPIPIELRVDLMTGVFQRLTAVQLRRSYAIFSQNIHVGSCTVWSFRGELDFASDPLQTSPLDAGAALAVAGQQGTRNIPRFSPGRYVQPFTSLVELASRPEFLRPGRYTVTAPGGSGENAVGPINAAIIIPAAVTWTNSNAFTDVERSQPHEITWTGGTADEVVNVFGFSSVGGVGAGFLCREPASAGRLTIPSYVLFLLPPSNAQNLLLVGTSTGARFSASGLDSGRITAVNGTGKTVSYR